LSIGENNRVSDIGGLRERRKGKSSVLRSSGTSSPAIPPSAARSVFRIGGTVVRDNQLSGSAALGEPSSSSQEPQRTIRFPDDEPAIQA